jgi:hypothetical protein
MRKTINRLGVLAMASLLLLFGVLLPAAVFADDADAGSATTNFRFNATPVEWIFADDATAKPVPTAAAEDTSAAIVAKSAVITGEVTKIAEADADGVTAITIDDGKDGVVLQISDLRFVCDQKLMSSATLDDVKVGMKLAAVLPEGAPMALSMPPQTGAAFGLILNSNADAFKIDVFDADLVSGDGNLKLNIGENTLIVGADGNETEAVAPNDELLVFYTVVATSQPAQTTPSLIVILSSATEDADVGEPAPDESAPAEYVGLRAAAEAKGYTVTWTSNALPITLTKGDITVTVTIGTDAFTYTHMTRDMQPLDSVEKLDLVTQLVDGKTMVASTFIELLK